MVFLKKREKARTLQAKSIDFYDTRETDEGMCAEDVDTDELHGQVDFHNTWQDHDSRFTTSNPRQVKEIGEARKIVQCSKRRDKSQCETILIMRTG